MFMDYIKKMIDLSMRMGDYPRNFLYEYRGDTTNNAPLVPISEANARRLIDRHSGNGYIIVSPCRGAEDFNLDVSDPQQRQDLAQINKERVNDFVNILKKTKWSYTPVYGGFIENKGTDHEENVYERSFIIYNKDRNGNPQNFDELRQFAINMARAYNQDSVLIKAPDGKPQYIKQDGSVDMEFDGDTKFNDFAQTYFTDLHRGSHKYKDGGTQDPARPTRFSFTEAYINPAPQCLSESHVRWASNEVTLNYTSR